MSVQKKLLKDILIEEPFRKKPLNLELVYDIKAEGLSNPLFSRKT